MSADNAREGTDSTDEASNWAVLRVLARPSSAAPGDDGYRPPQYEEIARHDTEAEAREHARGLDDAAHYGGTRHLVRPVSEVSGGEVVR